MSDRSQTTQSARMTEQTAWILGFDVGGTKPAAVAGSARGEIFGGVVFPSNAKRGFGPMWHDMVKAGKELTEPRGKPAAIGVSIGGPLDSARGIIHAPPNLPGWDEVPLKDM